MNKLEVSTGQNTEHLTPHSAELDSTLIAEIDDVLRAAMEAYEVEKVEQIVQRAETAVEPMFMTDRPTKNGDREGYHPTQQVSW